MKGTAEAACEPIMRWLDEHGLIGSRASGHRVSAGDVVHVWAEGATAEERANMTLTRASDGERIVIEVLVGIYTDGPIPWGQAIGWLDDDALEIVMRALAIRAGFAVVPPQEKLSTSRLVEGTSIVVNDGRLFERLSTAWSVTEPRPELGEEWASLVDERTMVVNLLNATGLDTSTAVRIVDHIGVDVFGGGR